MRDYRSSNSNKFSRDRGGRRPSMHDAVCDKCGRECKVPFIPTGNKPIYCSNCFEHQPEKSFGPRDFGRHDRSERRMFTAICDKCGNECEVPFKPTSGKPVFCSNCFDKSGSKRGDRGNDNRGSDNRQLQEQINAINNKLDKILQALGPEKKVEKTVKKVKKADKPKKIQKIEKAKKTKKVKKAKKTKTKK